MLKYGLVVACKQQPLLVYLTCLNLTTVLWYLQYITVVLLTYGAKGNQVCKLDKVNNFWI